MWPGEWPGVWITRRPPEPSISSLLALTPAERVKLGEWFPHLRQTYLELEIEAAPKAISHLSPITQ
jgi:hypothetical protein